MDLRHISFRLLEVFMSVVKTGSISETARRLHLTQPTVSLQIKRLQEAVDEPLVIIQQQKLHVTEAGHELFRTCQRVFGHFDDYNDFLAELKGGERGRCKIAMVNTAQYILPKLLGPYSNLHPHVELPLEIGNRAEVLARFERGEDDIYVFSHPPSLEHAKAARFLKNPLEFIVPTDHPLANQQHVALSELVKYRFLLREPGSATRMLFESELQRRGLVLSNSVQMASNEAIRVAVSSGMGIGVLSRHVLPIGDHGFKVLTVSDASLASHWYFVIRTDRHIAHAARSFLTFAQDHLEQYLDGRWVRNELHGLNLSLADQQIR
ncbi:MULTISPECIES: LysR family transcriptional regulator [unclassified Pseudoalteromonas]|uniref:LysR family transcriptional regulator n=1 Tax=unclassified Pseudoalteromonas TaxID=194690 RepID=UPI0015FFED6B|nr:MULTISPECIES: LysR family transcriptional regulator [unclassified Pseudoalteromonas]MBB1334824.1 LysR family transcriptional regulator [Pseudoalteromonas sp. SR41-6]MBB1340094.1 LysR family transcriptional regulator [Pseudoalteromonas sp. SR45-6]MBB1460385.1 LysR family transcriptional regulator [Pseudoalteromonas sp. SG41-8]